MENQYGLYLAREGTVIRLPVNPESYAVVKDNDNGSYNVLGIGPIMVPRTPKLQTVSWSGLLPGSPELGSVLTAGAFQPPKFYIDFIQAAMDEKAPIRFVANRYTEAGDPIFDTNMAVLVTKFKTEERGGETGDFYYEIALSEYRDYAPKTVKFQQSGPEEPVTATSEATRSVPKGQLTVGQSVVVSGECCRDSCGGKPHGTLSGFRGVISRIAAGDPRRPYPHHITDENGGARGWVKAAQIQAVTYTTNRTGSPGTLKFTLNASGGISFLEGDPVRFSADGRLIFLGWVFTKSRNRHAIIQVTCYDQLRYLKASASYCFVGRTAGEIITEIAEDFQLTVGRLDDTGYPLPTLIMEEKACLDIISTALQRTLLAIGTLYTFFDDGGALSLREAGAMVADGAVGIRSLLTDYQYKTGIDQQACNSVKLARPNEETGRADIFQAIDSANIGRWGLLQLYQTVDSALNGAQVSSQARAMLSYHNRRFRTLKVEALGLPGLRAGQMLMMDVPQLGDISLHKLVLLERVRHTFKNDLHTMDFDVQELGE